MSIARQIAAHAPLAVSGAKRMVTREIIAPDGLDYIATWNASMRWRGHSQYL